MPTSGTIERDHVFISYATEDGALADWVARKLASLGYAVWYDRLRLLGGENWPKNIEVAINDRTFRMLALLSRASLNKPNPEGERLKGFAIGKKLGITDFVIPLNVEGLRPDEITWNLQPINYIPFVPSWSEGLAAVVKKLESLKAPRVLNDGAKLAAASIVPGDAVRDVPEALCSNCFEVKQLPRYVSKYVTHKLSPQDLWEVRRQWPCRDVSPFRLLAFHEPPAEVTQRHPVERVAQVAWRDHPDIEGVNTRDLIASLVHKCLHSVQASRGLRYCEVTRQWFLPPGLLRNDRLTFTLPDGKRSWFRTVGERTYRTVNGTEVYRYHLSPSFAVLHGENEPLILFLRNRVYLTDRRGTRLEGRKVLSRRKHLCKNWFNKEWCVRALGVGQLLADDDMLIRVGPPGEQQLVINGMPIVLEAPRGLDDALVEEPDELYTAWRYDDDSVSAPAEED